MLWFLYNPIQGIFLNTVHTVSLRAYFFLSSLQILLVECTGNVFQNFHYVAMKKLPHMNSFSKLILFINLALLFFKQNKNTRQNFDLKCNNILMLQFYFCKKITEKIQLKFFFL